MIDASFDLNRQSATLPGTQRPGQSAIYRNALNLGKLPETDETGFSNCYDNLVISKCPGRGCAVPLGLTA